MRAIAYLVVRCVKNAVLETLRRPGRLVVAILTLGLIVGLVLLARFTPQDASKYLDLYWLKAIFFSLVMFLAVTSVLAGMKKGSAIFQMSDVNLLFVSPISPRKILLYGILSMARNAFLSGLFILFQSSTVKMGFGLGFSALLYLLVAYGVAVLMTQLFSLFLYMVTNSRPGRRRLAGVILALLCVPLAVVFFTNFARTGDYLAALTALAQSPAMSWFPVVGWASELAMALITGQAGRVVLFLILSAVFTAALTLLILRLNADYYEDVLVATQTAFEKQRALKEGNLESATASGKKIRPAKTGLAGRGASALFYKHLRESFRQNRLGLWNVGSIIYTVMSVLLAIFLRNEGSLLLILTQMLMWTQLFLIGMGRGLKELYMHYIYLIPDGSLSKIIWNSIETVVRAAVEAVVIFAAVGVIARLPILDTLGAAVAYMLFIFFLMGINYASLRVSGGSINAGLYIVLYIAAVIVSMLPGIIVAIILGSSMPAHLQFIGYLVLAAWELIAGLAYFAVGQGVLHRCDMALLPQGKTE